jgi:hypothetical protein
MLQIDVQYVYTRIAGLSDKKYDKLTAERVFIKLVKSTEQNDENEKASLGNRQPLNSNKVPGRNYP